MLGGLCLDACCGKLGFDEFSWTWLDPSFKNQGIEYVPSIAGHVTELIDSVSMICAGNLGTCGDAIRFDTPEWPPLKTWIEGGGKLFIAAEHSGNSPAHGLIFRCLQDMTRLNDFLSFMGSSMLYVGDDCNNSFPATGIYIPGGAKVAIGVNDFSGSRFGILSGGTTVFTGYEGGLDNPLFGAHNGLGLVACVAEAIGNGFIFVIGDSNCNSIPTSHKFIRKIFDTDKDNML